MLFFLLKCIYSEISSICLLIILLKNIKSINLLKNLSNIFFKKNKFRLCILLKKNLD